MRHDEIDREQKHLDVLYARLDDLRDQIDRQVADLAGLDPANPQQQLERDAAVAHYDTRRAALDAAEQGLCFGRIDTVDGSRHYIGRIGLRGAEEDAEPLLLDWRAPAARPFYLATAAAPEGIRVRRHITTHGRRVVDVNDELLDLEGGRDGYGHPDGLVGEATLMAALRAGRSGRMRDVVATLQREQDRVVRADHRGVLVVSGGPGTGKTAVALHRAAYLLYTHPEVAARAVLLVGPTPTFLGYISRVLPGLGETRAVLATVADLATGSLPAPLGACVEDPAVATVKGRLEMADVLAAAVRQRQGDLAGGDVVLDVDGDLLRLTPATIRRAVAVARDARLPHNLGRPIFCREILAELADQVAATARRRIDEVEEGFAADIARVDATLAAELDRMPAPVDVAGTDITGEPDAQELRQLAGTLAADPAVRAVLDRLWPRLRPSELIADLFSDPRRLAAAAPGLSAADRRLLLRTGPAAANGWSEADVPLLDEAADLLGEDTRAAEALAARRRARDVRYAQGVLDIVGSTAVDEEDRLGAADVVDAALLAARHEAPDLRTLAERAAADRTWTYGHVVVDEAQDLAPMAWRMLVRRCPTRSMTAVGDLAQAHTQRAASWREVLGPTVGRWREAELTVNYRTPAEVMAAAERVLALAHPASTPPRSIRAGGIPPWRRRTTAADLPATVAGCAVRERAALDEGTLAVLAPADRVPAIHAAVAARLPQVSAGASADLRSPVVVLAVTQAKGLEFDAVLVADPAGILADAPAGANDLYVAMTRTTSRLGIVHVGEPPAVLAAVPLDREPAGQPE